jgi:hypothetical protein
MVTGRSTANYRQLTEKPSSRARRINDRGGSTGLDEWEAKASNNESFTR